MTQTTYEFTAFTEADLLAAGAEGHSVSCGDTFTMVGTATTCISVTDDDPFLSGDNYCNENANDHYGQQASITGENGGEIGNGGQIYAEKYFWVHDDAGNWYVMIQVEQEGSNEEFFTFFNGYGYETPAEGTNLTVYSSCNVTSNWVDYKCLDAGEKEPEPGWIKGRLTLDADCNDNEWNDETGQWDAGIEGQTVKLLDLDGNVVAESVTDSYGNYMFDVPPGEYRVQFPEIEGLKFSAQDSGVAEHYDSDADENGLTDVITVSSGQTVANIDAGLKPATGSIEGRVFSDEDCDGVDGSITIVEGCDYCIEAEDMQSWGFKTVHGAQASGGELVKLENIYYGGDLKTTFDGKDGVYDFKLRVQDESDGQSHIMVKVNGVVVDTIYLNRDSDGYGSDDGGFSVFTIEGLELNAGDEIVLWAGGDGCEFVRIDKILLEGRDQEVRVEEPGVEGVIVQLLDANGDPVLGGDGQPITTTTDADGGYRFDDVPEGDYQVKFLNPDGTEFTFQDVGSDDQIDSDVNAGGVSNVVTVVADQTTSDVDAGLKPVALGSLSGRYFCDDDGDGLDNDGPNGGLGEGVAGVRVDLLDANGQLTGIFTTTAADGSYSFDDLEAGTYGVQFAGAPVGKDFTSTNANNNQNDDIDSDAIPTDEGAAVIFNIVVVAGEDTPDNDVGVTPDNEDPEAENVAAAVCADDMAVIDLLAAVSDPDGDTVEITSISATVDGMEVSAGVGDSITLAGGGVATLNADGTVSFNPNGAYDDLEIRDSEMDQFQFTASDGNGGAAMATADLKICGALNTIETIAEGFVDANGAPLQASYRVDRIVDVDFSTTPITITVDNPVTVIDPAPLDALLSGILGDDGTEVFDDNFA